MRLYPKNNLSDDNLLKRHTFYKTKNNSGGTIASMELDQSTDTLSYSSSPPESRKAIKINSMRVKPSEQGNKLSKQLTQFARECAQKMGWGDRVVLYPENGKAAVIQKKNRFHFLRKEVDEKMNDALKRHPADKKITDFSEFGGPTYMGEKMKLEV
jgi:hypothetical protein